MRTASRLVGTPGGLRRQEAADVLFVHRSERADRLVDELAALLVDRPDDPFAPDLVAVPAKGVERWITQRLSHVLGVGGPVTSSADGVCAHVLFPHPSALVADALAATGGDVRPAEDPWAQGRLLWTLLEVLDECDGEPWCAVVAGRTGGTGNGTGHPSRLGTVAHLARLFDSYGANRPTMLQAWLDDDDSDGSGSPIDDDLRWQAELWRRARQRIGTPSPAERLPHACALLRQQPDVVDLPGRLSLFGPTRLSTTEIDVLAALAEGRDVHLWLPHPSPVLWDAVAPFAQDAADVRRRDDPTVQVPRSPLLASLGRDSREMQLQLARLSAGGAKVVDAHHELPDPPQTLLGHLQRSLRQDVAPHTPAAGKTLPGPAAPLLASDDRSLQVHACHGPARQVEVLREVLVGMLAADPTLEPRDVLVMCPDIEDYAPLISATFGLATAEHDDDAHRRQHPGHRLRVRLADRSLRQTNPVLATLAAVLEMPAARVTASEVLDFAASPPVRRRFGFTDDELDRLQVWVRTSGVRWGLDAEHRRTLGLDVPQNTWRAGLDRVLLGAAMTEDDLRWVGLALPLDDVDSNDIDLAGRLAELVSRLAHVLDQMTGTRPLAAWVQTLTRALDTLTAVRDQDSWQWAQARRELADLVAAAGPRADTVGLTLADLHALLADRLAGRPTRANFRTGTLTMCSMVPMRSVPHRVVCLLGLDDGRFPRTAGSDGDDVLGRAPRVGERDARSEDRQLLLDAVLAARDHLVVLYTGANPRTNARRPPAVPVGEILDTVDGLVRTRDGRPARESVVRHQPLQPFDARNFTAGLLGTQGPFSFDQHALTGARRRAEPREQPPPFLPAPLPMPSRDVDAGTLELETLYRFLEHPVRAFLRQRLQVTLARDEDEPRDSLTVEMDPLEKWGVGDRLLRGRLSGLPADRCCQAEWRRGSLPPKLLGRRLLDELMDDVEPLVAAASEVRLGDARTVDVSVDVNGRSISGTVGGVHADTVVRVEYSRLGPKHRLRAWTQLLAVTAADPTRPWTAVTIGRGQKGVPVARSTLGPVEPALSRRLLAEIVDLYEWGMCAPLPMAVKTSAAYAEKRGGGMTVANALVFAEREWAPEQFGGERDEEPHRLVLGGAVPLGTLVDEPAGVVEHGPGWPVDETSRFGQLARRLWQPLLAAERMDTP